MENQRININTNAMTSNIQKHISYKLKAGRGKANKTERNLQVDPIFAWQSQKACELAYGCICSLRSWMYSDVSGIEPPFWQCVVITIED